MFDYKIFKIWIYLDFCKFWCFISDHVLNYKIFSYRILWVLSDEDLERADYCIFLPTLEEQDKQQVLVLYQPIELKPT